MEQIATSLGHGRASSPLRATSRSGSGVYRPTRPVETDPPAPSEGEARVFVARAIAAMATLGIGSADLRELLSLMLHFLPQQALVSGRPWLPMGAGKLAGLAGITKRTLASRVARLRKLGLLKRHLDGYNHPARAADGSRCGYDLTPLVERAAELNAGLDDFFADHKIARSEARRSASHEADERVRAASPRPVLTLTRRTGGADGGVTPIKTIHPDSTESSVTGTGKDDVRLTEGSPTTHAEPNAEPAWMSTVQPKAMPSPQLAGRLLARLSPEFDYLLRGQTSNLHRAREGQFLAAAVDLARHLGVPQSVWASVPPGRDRVSLAAIVVLGQAQDAEAFRTSRVAWVTAMLRRPDMNPWPSVYRALVQKERGLPAKPNHFLGQTISTDRQGGGMPWRVRGFLQLAGMNLAPAEAVVS